MVPRIVHQTWKDSQFEYWVFKRSQQSIAEHLPHWEYRFWTDEDLERLVRTHYADRYQSWLTLQPFIKRVDMARYFILHRLGGLYADLDFIFTAPIDDLVDVNHRLYFYRSYQAIAKGWDFLGNAFMMSFPGEQFWLNLVDFQLALPPTTPVLHHTGPLSIGQYHATLQEPPPIRIFGPDYFDNDRCGDGVGDHRYGYHMRLGSWQREGFKA